MADLDSFFAKKDKKKVKGKKFTTTDEIARRLEETEKKLEKEYLKEVPIKKLIEDPVEETTENNPIVVKTPPQPTKKEEEEWNDFEVSGDKDLTDLKITKLQIENEEDGGGGGGNTDDGDNDGEGNERKDGVWKTEKPPIIHQPILEEEAEESEESKPNANNNVIGGSYVPPHMRNMAPSPLPRQGGHRRGNKQAPDITNEMAFPSLSDAQASNPLGAWGRKNRMDDRQGFENVRHGSTRISHNEYSAPKLSTANRFDALTDNS